MKSFWIKAGKVTVIVVGVLAWVTACSWWTSTVFESRDIAALVNMGMGALGGVTAVNAGIVWFQ